MPEQAALVGLAERRAAPELERTADVVEKRGCKEEVVAQAGVQLRGLAAQRRDAHRVLQETARVAVMTLGSRGR